MNKTKSFQNYIFIFYVKYNCDKILLEHVEECKMKEGARIGIVAYSPENC